MNILIIIVIMFIYYFFYCYFIIIYYCHHYYYQITVNSSIIIPFCSYLIYLIIASIILGVCLVLLLSGDDAINTVSEFIYQNNQFGFESVYVGNDGNQVRQLTELIFDSRVTGVAGMWKKKK